MNNIWNELNSVFQDVFDDNKLQISHEMTAADIDAWDSVNHISLVIAIEDHFHVRLSTAEVAQLKNVGEMASLLERLLSK